MIFNLRQLKGNISKEMRVIIVHLMFEDLVQDSLFSGGKMGINMGY